MKLVSLAVLLGLFSALAMAESAQVIGDVGKRAFEVPRLAISNYGSSSVPFADRAGPVDWIYPSALLTSATKKLSARTDYKLLNQAPSKDRDYKLQVQEADPQVDPKFVIDPTRLKR